MDVEGTNITQLLRSWRSGDHEASKVLLPLIYDTLRDIAERCLKRERVNHTLRPTDLVSEAYLRLAHGEQPEWDDRRHFFAVAAGTMRRILIDYARMRRASKRGGGLQAVPLDDQLAVESQSIDLIALDLALEALAAQDSRKANALELHYFGGLNQEEIASVLDIHVNTVASDLRLAKAYIRRRLQDHA